MTVSLTLVDRTIERIRLALDGDGTSVTRILRVDGNGAAPVRLTAGALPTGADLTVDDYEYCAVAGTSLRWVVYAGSSIVAELELAPEDVGGNSDTGLGYLTCPMRPALGQPLYDPDGGSSATSVLTSYTDARDTQSTVHKVIGRADPVVVLRTSSTRAGTLQFTAATLASARSLADVLGRGYVWMFRGTDQDTLDLYFAVQRVGLSHADQPDAAGGLLWTVSIDYTEVAAPGQEISLTEGWDWGAVVADYGTWAELLVEFETWADLAEGP